jgi:hypothetical protein
MKKFSKIIDSLIPTPEETLDGLMYIGSKFKNLKYPIKYTTQKIFRANHIADNEIWNLYCYLARDILPKLIAFKNAKRMGTPIFDGQSQDETKDEETNRVEKWDDILDKMIFGMKWIVVDNWGKSHKKYEKELKAQYGDWDAKVEENKSYFLFKKLPSKNGEEEMFEMVDDPSELSEDDIKEEIRKNGDNWLEKATFYYNVKLHNELSMKAQEGLKLFGEYFWNLWD